MSLPIARDTMHQQQWLAAIEDLVGTNETWRLFEQAALAFSVIGGCEMRLFCPLVDPDLMSSKRKAGPGRLQASG